jgi:hypothetical protein
MVTAERVQSGLRIERTTLKVLKGLAEYLDMSLGDLVEGIVLHTFDGKTPFSPETLAKIGQLKAVYGHALTAADSHMLTEHEQAQPEPVPHPTRPAPISPVGRSIQMTGTIELPLPPHEAFPLFTPRGEERWVEGWHPYFPAPVADDTAPGTVFETHAAPSPATWIVLDRDPGRRMRYARVTPGDKAGTVTVELAETPTGGTEVTVTYDMTPLSEAAADALGSFAASYPEYLASWKTAITASLARDHR